jgi:hypothetical protein
LVLQKKEAFKSSNKPEETNSKPASSFLIGLFKRYKTTFIVPDASAASVAKMGFAHFACLIEATTFIL